MPPFLYEWNRNRQFNMNMHYSGSIGGSRTSCKVAKLSRFSESLDQPRLDLIERICKKLGAYVLKGPPGSGKSTLLLHTARELRKQRSRVLLTTYTRAMAKELDDGTKEFDIDGVDVQHVDKIAKNISKEMRHCIDDDESISLLLQAEDLIRFGSKGERTSRLGRLIESAGQGYLLHEIEHVIVGLDLETFEKYLNLDRRALGLVSHSETGTFRLSKERKELIWKLHESFADLLMQNDVTTWP
jgi:energy-coupling factor transporter ATP-binding protein EcfA2